MLSGNLANKKRQETLRKDEVMFLNLEINNCTLQLQKMGIWPVKTNGHMVSSSVIGRDLVKHSLPSMCMIYV